MIEDKGSLFKRFRVWLANLIGGKDYVWEMDSLRGAIEGWRKSNTTLKRLLQKAEDVQEGKVDHSDTFCWWCGGLKHDMTKISAMYCDGAALLAQESPEKQFASSISKRTDPLTDDEKRKALAEYFCGSQEPDHAR